MGRMVRTALFSALPLDTDSLLVSIAMKVVSGEAKGKRLWRAWGLAKLERLAVVGCCGMLRLTLNK
jgi:hypothetical protein